MCLWHGDARLHYAHVDLGVHLFAAGAGSGERERTGRVRVLEFAASRILSATHWAR